MEEPVLELRSVKFWGKGSNCRRSYRGRGQEMVCACVCTQVDLRARSLAWLEGNKWMKK